MRMSWYVGSRQERALLPLRNTGDRCSGNRGSWGRVVGTRCGPRGTGNGRWMGADLVGFQGIAKTLALTLNPVGESLEGSE